MKYVFFLIAVAIFFRGPFMVDNTALLLAAFIAIGYLAGISAQLKIIIDRQNDIDIGVLYKRNNEGKL
jgi:hypothetical protein